MWLTWPDPPQGEHMNGLTPGSCCAFPPEAVVETSFTVCTAVTAQNPWLLCFTHFPAVLKASLLPSPLPTNTLLSLRTALHVGCPWFSLSNCEIFRGLFTLCAVGQSCPGGALKAFPDLCTSTRPSLITGPQGDCKTRVAPGSRNRPRNIDYTMLSGWIQRQIMDGVQPILLSEREKKTDSSIWKITSLNVSGIFFFRRSLIYSSQRNASQCNMHTVHMENFYIWIQVSWPWSRKALEGNNEWVHTVYDKKELKLCYVWGQEVRLGFVDIWKSFKACCYLSYRLWDSSQADAISRGGTQQNGRKFLLGLLPSAEKHFSNQTVELLYKESCSDWSNLSCRRMHMGW